jgi:hypothetical protein
VLKLLTVKTCHVTNHSQRPRTWADPFVGHKQWKREPTYNKGKHNSFVSRSYKETGLEANAEKTNCMIKPHEQNAEQYHNMTIDNISFEMEEEFKYLRTTPINQNCIHEEITDIFKSGDACHHSMKNPLSSSSLSKNLKIKICRTIILLVVLFGC